ncbi:hypothetical protein BST53_21560 [Vibrio vulnificus]|nr:hypothetical protein BST53_21560 [Vibrio vulnificus]
MVGSPRITKHLRGIHNAWQFWFELTLVFTAQWLRSGGLRCSPLNAALCFNHEKSVGCIFSLLSRLSNFGLVGKLAFGGRCFLDSYSWARKIQRIASLKLSAFVSRIKRLSFKV